VSNKENANIDKYMQDLKRIKREYTKVMETDQAEKARFQQQEFISANEDITLLLNEDTRINNSFINESQHKILNHNTPSKTPSRAILGSKSGNKLKKDDSMCLLTNSHMSASIDRNEKTNEKMNESLFLKSHEFPKLLKRKTTRPYTKVLIPVPFPNEVSADRGRSQGPARRYRHHTRPLPHH
jgi:hypothetical protein